MFRRPFLLRFTSPYSTCKRQKSPFILPVDAPVPKKTPFAAHAHGRTWEDPFHWMSNTADPHLTDHLLRENSYANSFMADTDDLSKKLAAEMKSRMPATISTPPESWGNWLYYQYIPEGKEYPVFCRRRKNVNGLFGRTLCNWLSGHGEEEVLLDWNKIAEQFGYVNIGTCRISPDHKLIAYTLDTTGSEVFTLQVEDLQTRHMVLKSNKKGVISLAWTGDSSCILYTVCDESQRPYKVFCTNLGSNVIDDLLFTESNPSCCVDITATKDGKYITINSNSRSSSEVHVMDATNLNDGIWLVRVRVPGVQYFLEHHDGFFYILTNTSMEETTFATTSEYQIIRCKAEKSMLDNWKVVIKPDEGMAFQDMDMFDGHLVLSVLKEGIPSFCSIGMHMLVDQEKPMQVQDLQPWVFPVPSGLCNILPGSNLDFMSSIYRVVISSPVMSDIVVDYDLKRRNFAIMHQEVVLGSISNSEEHFPSNKTFNKKHLCTRKDLQKWGDITEEFTCERREVVSHDGARVPLTIVYSRQARMGKAPGILHGYGAYGEVLDKSFCSNNISLLARGWIIAYSDVRGGGGDPAWHKAGTGLCKLNSFYDFAECAKFLINEGYVHKNQLAAMGCSAGGLLVGATINMFPDLFSAATLKVPFLDVCNTLLDPSLPLTNLDYDEFGDPRLEKDFETIHGYSPYDNIHANVCYPSVMVTSSFHDSRVGVWEAAKWVARVREKTCSNCSRWVILKTNMSGGHFPEGGRYSQCKDAAYEYAFLMKAMGLLEEENNFKVL